MKLKLKTQKLKKKSPNENNIKSKELNSSSNKSTEKTQIKNSNLDEKEDPIITAYNEIIELTSLLKEYFLRRKSSDIDYMLGAFSLKFKDEDLSIELLNKKLKLFFQQLDLAMMFNRLMKNPKLNESHAKIIEIYKEMADHIEKSLDDVVMTSNGFIDRLLSERPDKRSKSDAIKSDEKKMKK